MFDVILCLCLVKAELACEILCCILCAMLNVNADSHRGAMVVWHTRVSLYYAELELVLERSTI